MRRSSPFFSLSLWSVRVSLSQTSTPFFPFYVCLAVCVSTVSRSPPSLYRISVSLLLHCSGSLFHAVYPCLSVIVSLVFLSDTLYIHSTCLHPRRHLFAGSVSVFSLVSFPIAFLCLFTYSLLSLSLSSLVRIFYFFYYSFTSPLHTSLFASLLSFFSLSLHFLVLVTITLRFHCLLAFFLLTLFFPYSLPLLLCVSIFF